MSSSTIKVVSDDTISTDLDVDEDGRYLPIPIEGMSYVRKQQVYCVTTLASTTFYEVTSMLQEVSKTTSDSIAARKALDLTHVGSALSQALDCIDIATEYLAALNIEIRALLSEDPDS